MILSCSVFVLHGYSCSVWMGASETVRFLASRFFKSFFTNRNYTLFFCRQFLGHLIIKRFDSVLADAEKSKIRKNLPLRFCWCIWRSYHCYHYRILYIYKILLRLNKTRIIFEESNNISLAIQPLYEQLYFIFRDRPCLILYFFICDLSFLPKE